VKKKARPPCRAFHATIPPSSSSRESQLREKWSSVARPGPQNGSRLKTHLCCEKEVLSIRAKEKAPTREISRG
jgi:hypothetical protein